MKDLFRLSFLVLFVFQSCESEQLETFDKIEQDPYSLQLSPEVVDYIINVHKSQGDRSNLKNAGNSDNKPFFVSQYSDFFGDYMVFAPGMIPNTNLLVLINYPTNGEDRALINGEWIMANWGGQGPTVLLVDLSDDIPKLVYSNWCEDDKSGYFHLRSRAKLVEWDLDGDGMTDVWRWTNFDEETKWNFNGKTTLTDGLIDLPVIGSGVPPIPADCMDATTEVDLKINGRNKNGEIEFKIVLDGVTYKD